MFNTLLSMRGEDDAWMSLGPRLAKDLNVAQQPERVPLAVLITTSISICASVFLLTPLAVRLARPLLKPSNIPAPRPEQKVRRFLIWWCC